MWVSRAIAIWYRWKIGNGGSIKFWEDIWFGNSPWQSSSGTFTLSQINKLKRLVIFGMATNQRYF
jgi:hypothetical protein